MRKLKIEQCLENIQATYHEPSICWEQECAEFLLNENSPNTGRLIVWKDDVPPELIGIEIGDLKLKIDQFLLAMQIMDNPRMRKGDEPTINYRSSDGKEFSIPTRCPQELLNVIEMHERGEPYGRILGGGFNSTLQAKVIMSPVSLPKTFPQTCLEFQRLIGIFSEAEYFSGPYLVEHQLRNYFLIMEECCDTNKGRGVSKPDFYNDVKMARDFVSHAIIDYPNPRSFLEKNFPESIIHENGNTYAKFDRSKDSHINFIRIYRDKAYLWVKDCLKNLSHLG
ncbi:hypothetical protein IVG45_09960 [Methylomonas sp. LL1]|uniref:hypothetical protein n=1 Tax=Methylomonas sp. LL1 TaxID=2785785 RepID=UPI0018C3FE12|nr:hypothetical protein [Methylomonas sp. LL1]QPK65223.1 hypothetical protein IVG45_09960 [Methylomonas sp. LL1]